MNIHLYEIVYTMGNFFMAYVICKFMYVFYTETKVNKYIEILSYIAYFVCITLVHTAIKVPIIVAVSNMILLFLLTLLYSWDIRKNVLSVLLIYISLACAETLAVVITHFIYIDILNPYEYDSVIGIIVVRMTCLIVVLLLSSFKNVKNGYLIPRVYWIGLFIVPVGTIILLFSSISGKNVAQHVVIISTGTVLLINITTFYLYDSISKLMAEKMDQCLMAQKNKYYENQLDLMKDALSNTRTIQHDLRNKLSPIYTLALNGENEKLIKRLSELTNLCTAGEEYASSGNSAVDSIINFKLQEAKKEDIQISCQVLIPKELNVSSFDIAIILGNIIDNAVTGTKTIETDRWIDINIKYSKGRLIITISNSFDGIVLEEKGNMITRKEDKDNHGLGLRSVQTAIEKYNGAMNVHYTNHKFKVRILMYV